MGDPSRPVTGYPAPNGPYAGPAPYYNQQPPQYNPQRATFLRRFFGVIIGCVIITGTIIFISWLVLRPRYPQFRVDAFAVTGPFNMTANSLSSSWDVALTARNPNGKITLNYDEIRAAVFYRGESLADTYLPPFVQGKNEETPLKASFAAANTFVDSDDVDGINQEMRKADGKVAFSVWLVADVRFTAGIWRRRRFLKVYCGDLLVSVSANGTGLTGGPKQCSLGL